MGFGLSKSQSLEELTPLGSMGAGTELTPPTPSYGKEPSSWIFEVKEEGRSLTMRSSHPGSDSVPPAAGSSLASLPSNQLPCASLAGSPTVTLDARGARHQSNAVSTCSRQAGWPGRSGLAAWAGSHWGLAGRSRGNCLVAGPWPGHSLEMRSRSRVSPFHALRPPRPRTSPRHFWAGYQLLPTQIK